MQGTNLGKGRARAYRRIGSMCHLVLLLSLLLLLWVSLELGGCGRAWFGVGGQERRYRRKLGVCDDMLRVRIEAVDELLLLLLSL